MKMTIRLKFKKIIILGSIICGVLPVFCLEVSATNSNENIGVYQLLDVSLGALRQKAQDVAERNQWLRDEMVSLEKEMTQMRNELKALEADRLSFQDGQKMYQDMMENLSVVEKQVLRADMSLGQLQSERRRLEVQLDKQVSRRSMIQERLAGVVSDVQEMKGIKIKSVVVPNQNNSQEAEVSRYRSLVEQSVISLERIEREYERVLKKFERPAQKVERLKFQKEENLQMVRLLEDEIKISYDEETILDRQIKEAQEKRQNEITALREKLTDLKGKQYELGKVLVQARTTIESRNLVLDVDSDLSSGLEENLSVITQQNLVLKDKLNSLQKTLKDLNY